MTSHDVLIFIVNQPTNQQIKKHDKKKPNIRHLVIIHKCVVIKIEITMMLLILRKPYEMFVRWFFLG